MRAHRRPVAWAVAIAGAVLGVFALTRLTSPTNAPAAPPGYLVGAYYYTWYHPAHWAATGYAGRHLPSPLEPLLGEYVSDHREVITSHIQWASEYDIDFLIISWSHAGSFADQAARRWLLPALAESAIRQAPTLELLSYGERDLGNPGFRQRLAEDVKYLGEHYLKHPSALRVDGKPVLFLYVTRVLIGDVASWIADVRRLLEADGIDAFIVADEVFWHEPDPARLRLYDAVTAYNVYDWPRSANAGYAGASTFLADVEGLFSRWKAAADAAGTRFIPNAMPGYNDRGVRPAENHYVIPRALAPGASITSLFERSVDLARRFADPALPIVTITSFNEWHEWTQVEPVRRSDRPAPPDAAAITQGFPHEPYRFEYLEVIRDRLGDGRRAAAPP